MPTSQSPAPSAAPFLLLFRNAGPDSHAHLTEAQKAELTRQWNDWFGRLTAEGKLSQGRPLDLGGRVVSGPQGRVVTDGPFAEAKEAVGGYFLLTVADIEEATEIARQCPGLAIGLTVEVRPVLTCSPVLTGVRGG